ncbi:MAG TPA: ETC complex I subunit [Devosia sp.]|nr:ETC complex I subunit [Devosia sp.]
MTARIYRPAPNAMQSGKGKSRDWVLIYEQASARGIDPLMGYATSADTRQQLKLSFDTLEAAEAYAQKNGIAYAVQPAHEATPKRVSYPDNFRSDRKTPWTH